MNTKFFLYIFLIFTGTVLAQDVPPVVRKALTQEELRNAEESKAALMRMKEHGDKCDAKQLIQALNNKDRNCVLKKTNIEQIIFENHLVNVVLIASFAAGTWAMIAYFGGVLLGYKFGRDEGYNDGHKDGKNEGIAIGSGVALLQSAMNGLNGQR